MEEDKEFLQHIALLLSEKLSFVIYSNEFHRAERRPYGSICWKGSVVSTTWRKISFDVQLRSSEISDDFYHECYEKYIDALRDISTGKWREMDIKCITKRYRKRKEKDGCTITFVCTAALKIGG